MGTMRSWVWSWFVKDVPARGRARCEVLVKKAGFDEEVECAQDFSYKGGSTTGMILHIENAHKHIHAGQFRQSIRYGPMDDHVQRTPRFLDSYMRWMIATYQPINTCEHPKFRAMVEAAGNAKDIHWFG